jgi:hypothetical protein
MNYPVPYRAGSHGIIRRCIVVIWHDSVVTVLVGHQPDDPNRFRSEPKLFRVEPRWSRLDPRVVLGAVIAADFSILFQPFTAQLSTHTLFYFPLSSYKSPKTLTKQQRTVMIGSFYNPTITIYTRHDYSVESSLASI